MATRLIPCPICQEKNNFQIVFVAQGNRGVPFISPTHPVALCKNCGFCFLNPQHEESDYLKYYKTYDRPVGKKVKLYGSRAPEKGKDYDRIRLEFLLPFLKDQSAKILDIGSGYGRFLYQLQQHSFTDLHGLEPNQEASQQTKEEFPFPIHTWNLYNPSLPNNEFDVILLIAVIEHFTDPVRALKGIFQLLKPGGVFYVNTPNVRDVVLRQGINKYFKFVHTLYFSETSLKNCLRAAGFEIVSSYTLPAITKYSTFFGPENYSNSELNILARKPASSQSAFLEKEDWREIKIYLKNQWLKDRYYDSSRKIIHKLRHLPIIGIPFQKFHSALMKPNPLSGIHSPTL